MLKRRWLPAVLLMSVLPLPPVHGQAPAARDQVVIGMAEEPDTLNPLVAQTPAAEAVLDTIFIADVQRDHTWKLFPQGVRALPNLRDGTWKVRGDAMTLVWTLKPRDWHDGTPVACGDFSFAHRVASNPDVRVRNRDLTNRIGRIDCPQGDGGARVVVHWKERYAHAHTMVSGHGALPRHVLDPIFRQSPVALNEAKFGSDPSSTIGDGAYKFVQWRRGRSLTVDAMVNHRIFGTPSVRRITWRFVADRHALAASMRAGSIDAISTIGIATDQAEQLDREEGGRIKVFFEPGSTWEHIDFNLDNPLLQDVRVRRAIAHAINREEISRLFSGRQPVAHSYLPPRHPAADAAIKYAYAPDRARSLLRDAGWTPGPDGLLRNSAGRQFRIEIGTTAGNRARERVEQSIQRNLRDVGIELTIRNFPAKVFLGEIIGRRRFAALALYAWMLSPTADCDQLYTSDGVPSEANGWMGQNYPGYRNTEMDKACKSAAGEVDEDRRARLLADSVRVFSRDLPALPLYTWATVAAAKPALGNFAAVRMGSTYETWNAHKWYWQ
jgi:peptide/nickel transport system substrate-binding protein